MCLRPTKLSHDGAATLPYACLKVWDALVNQGSIKPIYGLRDKHILIVDGGSPTGVVALQVAKEWQGKYDISQRGLNSSLCISLRKFRDGNES